MARWIWESVLSIEVPADWEVRDSSDLVEIVSPGSAGAAHLSVFNKETPALPKKGEASAWVENFARERGATDFSEVSEYVTPAGLAAEFTFTERRRELLHWMVGVQIWTKRAVLFTYNDDGTREDLHFAAEMMFRSTEPSERS